MFGVFFPDDCQAIKDDDFVLFFSPSFCVTAVNLGQRTLLLCQ